MGGGQSSYSHARLDASLGCVPLRFTKAEGRLEMQREKARKTVRDHVRSTLHCGLQAAALP